MNKSFLASVMATASLAGCLQTIPTKQDDNKPVDNTPRPVATSVTSVNQSANGNAANNNGTASLPRAKIKWNDESCNKELTENKLKTSDVCVRFIQSAAPVAAAATKQPTARTSLKAAMPGTKEAANAKAPATTTQPVGPVPESTIYTLRVGLSECGVTSNGGLVQSAGGVLGGLATSVGTALKQGANRVAGGGVAGRAASETVGGVTGSTTQSGQRTVQGKQQEILNACQVQTTNFINDDFKAAITGLSADFSKTNPGYKAVYTVTSELPPVYDAALKAAAGAQSPAPTRR